MEWQDHGIIVSVRPHGENAAIVHILTENHGRSAGYVRAARSSSHRPVVQIGNLVSVQWRARTQAQLGSFTLELIKAYPAQILSSPKRLQALRSACALIQETLPESNKYSNIFNGLSAFLDSVSSQVWAQAYVVWEINLLRALGFGLHLDCCAVDHECHEPLAYVSPRTGRGVCRHHAEPYKEKLLKLPSFLTGHLGEETDQQIIDGLMLSGTFFERFIFHPVGKTLPEARKNLIECFDVSEKYAKHTPIETPEQAVCA